MNYKYLSVLTIVLMISIVSAYSEYGSPSEFGNETTTTVWIGGDYGILNISGNAKIEGNSTSSNFFGFINWSWIQNSPIYLLISDFSTSFDSNFSAKTTDDLTQGITNLYANQTLNNELYWNKTENINASGYNGTFSYITIESPALSCSTIGTNCFTVQVNGSTQTCVCFDYNVNVNSSNYSDYLDTNDGSLDNIDTDMFKINAGTLTVVQSWWNNLYYLKTEIDTFLNNYFNKTEIFGFNYYNSTDFDIADYSTTTEADLLYCSITEPLWTANLTNQNASWITTYNSTYDAYNDSGYIKNWNESGLIQNWTEQYTGNISGTTTANYVPYSVSSNVLGNSNIYFDGIDKVGINHQPSTNFDVYSPTGSELRIGGGNNNVKARLSMTEYEATQAGGYGSFMEYDGPNNLAQIGMTYNNVDTNVLTMNFQNKLGVKNIDPVGDLDLKTTAISSPGYGNGIYLTVGSTSGQIFPRYAGRIAFAPNISKTTNFVDILNSGDDLVYEFQASGTTNFRGYDTPVQFETRGSSAGNITFAPDVDILGVGVNFAVNGNVEIGGISSGAKTLIESSDNTTTLRLTDSSATCDLNPEPTGLLQSCSSDESLKENIREATTEEKHERINRVLTFGQLMKSYKLKSNNLTYLGVIAQDIQSIYPEMVVNQTLNEIVGYENKTTFDIGGKELITRVPIYVQVTNLAVNYPSQEDMLITINYLNEELSLIKSELAKKT